MRMMIAANGLPCKEGEYPEVKPSSTMTDRIAESLGAEWCSPEIPMNETEAVTIVHHGRGRRTFVKHLRKPVLCCYDWEEAMRA